MTNDEQISLAKNSSIQSPPPKKMQNSLFQSRKPPDVLGFWVSSPVCYSLQPCRRQLTFLALNEVVKSAILDCEKKMVAKKKSSSVKSSGNEVWSPAGIEHACMHEA